VTSDGLLKASPPKTSRVRADGQMTGLAGEFFVAAELLKRGLQTSVTFGNAKSIDLLAHNPKTGKSFTVQVKAVRKRTPFPISHLRVQAHHTYVFVILNRPNVEVEYFIVPGATLANEPERFSKWFVDPRFPGIYPTFLASFADGWSLFDE